jgi:hypothetical protein
MLLHGGVVAAAVWFILCASLVLGFFIICFLLRVGSWLDYFGRNLSKKGWLGFSPIWGFPRINSCVSCTCLCCLYFQYMI